MHVGIGVGILFEHMWKTELKETFEFNGMKRRNFYNTERS